jgi:hypothetical protein
MTPSIYGMVVWLTAFDLSCSEMDELLDLADERLLTTPFLLNLDGLQ